MADDYLKRARQARTGEERRIYLAIASTWIEQVSLQEDVTPRLRLPPVAMLEMPSIEPDAPEIATEASKPSPGDQLLIETEDGVLELSEDAMEAFAEFRRSRLMP